jgi:hypothetical protein
MGVPFQRIGSRVLWKYSRYVIDSWFLGLEGRSIEQDGLEMYSVRSISYEKEVLDIGSSHKWLRHLKTLH